MLFRKGRAFEVGGSIHHSLTAGEGEGSRAHAGGLGVRGESEARQRGPWKAGGVKWEPDHGRSCHGGGSHSAPWLWVLRVEGVPVRKCQLQAGQQHSGRLCHPLPPHPLPPPQEAQLHCRSVGVNQEAGGPLSSQKEAIITMRPGACKAAASSVYFHLLIKHSPGREGKPFAAA